MRMTSILLSVVVMIMLFVCNMRSTVMVMVPVMVRMTNDDKIQ